MCLVSTSIGYAGNISSYFPVLSLRIEIKIEYSFSCLILSKISPSTVLSSIYHFLNSNIKFKLLKSIIVSFCASKLKLVIANTIKNFT